MSKMYTRATFYTALLALVAAGLSLVGCNDSPTAIGSDYLPEDVKFAAFQLGADDISVTSGIAAVGNSSGAGVGTMLVGRAGDTSSAVSLIGLTHIDSLIHGSSPKTIISTRLQLNPLSYVFGDTTSRQTSFDVVVLDEPFTLNTQWSESIASRIESAPSLGTYTGTLPDSGTILVDLDLTATTTFLKEYYQFEQASGDSSAKFTMLKSLALRPHSDAQRIVAFRSPSSLIADTLRPTLVLGLGDTTLAMRFDVSTWISQTPAMFGDGRIVLAGGVPVRTWIKINLDSIPSPATIHQATLTFHIDPSRSQHGTAGPLRSFAVYTADAETGTSSKYLTTSITSVISAFRPAIDSTTFSDEIRIQSIAPTITSWLRFRRGEGGRENNGIILALDRGIITGDPETSTVDYLTLFGPDAADTSLRPTLTIMYSRQEAQNAQ